MKKHFIQIALALVACCAHGQGTLQFDQQVNPTSVPGTFNNIVPGPTGQSFVPSLNSIGFVQLYFNDDQFNGIGATIDVNLWSGAIGTGTLLGTSSSVLLPDAFSGSATFLFSTPLSVTSGTSYFLQPVIESGDNFVVGIVSGPSYPNGTAFFNGTAASTVDLWFREGIVGPEPSSFSLAVLGLIGIYPVWQNRSKSKSVNEPPSTRRNHKGGSNYLNSTKDKCFLKRPELKGVSQRYFNIFTFIRFPRPKPSKINDPSLLFPI